ncbi:mechanosensitive ion channel family protein [Myroides injenensis]|uniref:mechanosensitive ion channel family protein n=1 Tax=Myroides injenensis TaxID=1183151 RepID=UPI000289FEA4|nr:mechanosensitive ion channel family protein [Myroides injenensis]
MERIISSFEKILEDVLTALPKYAIGLVVLLVGFYLIKFIVKFLANRFIRRDVDKSLQGFLIGLIRIVLYVVLLVVVAGIMGFKSMSLTAIFGAAGLTVGLALQGSLSNFAGGVLILVFSPFKVGDYISNTSGTEGTVESIGLLYTIITGPTGLKIFSPNGPLANSVITNYTEITSRRYDFVVGISYDSNIKEARQVILDALAKIPAVLQTPAASVFVTNLADSSVNLNVRVWMDKTTYWDTVYEVQQSVKVALDDAKINIPFPQTELHIVSDATK